MPYRTARPEMWAVLLFGCFVLVSSCRKPDENLGLDILDPADALGTLVIDSTTIRAYTVEEGGVRTNNLSRVQLGSYVDPVFGMVKASVVTQIRLAANNVGSGQDPSQLICDSVVLSMVYDPVDPIYGDRSAQRFAVYEVAEDLFTDSTYMSTDTTEVFSDDLMVGHMSLIAPRPDLPVVVGGDTLLPQLRLPLRTDLGQRFLNVFGMAEMADNAMFTQFFKGLHITTENVGQAPFQGGVMSLDLLAAQSKLTVYYRNQVDPDTLELELVINSSAVRYTQSRHGHAGAVEPGLPLVLQDSLQGGERNFLQALGGTRVRFDLPHISAYDGMGLRALAKAELVVPIAGPIPDQYPPPRQLFLFRNSDEGADLLLPDQLASGSNIGGGLNAAGDGYSFIITRYVQGVINGTFPEVGLSIVPGNGGVSVSRAVVSGPTAVDRPMKLILTFTTY